MLIVDVFARRSKGSDVVDMFLPKTGTFAISSAKSEAGHEHKEQNCDPTPTRLQGTEAASFGGDARGVVHIPLPSRRQLSDRYFPDCLHGRRVPMGIQVMVSITAIAKITRIYFQAQLLQLQARKVVKLISFAT